MVSPFTNSRINGIDWKVFYTINAYKIVANTKIEVLKNGNSFIQSTNRYAPLHSQTIVPITNS